jgi:hypothetical protein
MTLRLRLAARPRRWTSPVHSMCIGGPTSRRLMPLSMKCTPGASPDGCSWRLAWPLISLCWRCLPVCRPAVGGAPPGDCSHGPRGVAMTFVFAVIAGIGFVSVNISDVTLARASRVTPAAETARGALADAVTSRDWECKGGFGRFCRQREATVTDRRQVLDSMRPVERRPTRRPRPRSESSLG